VCFDLVGGVYLSERDENVGQNAGVLEIDRLHRGTESLGDELAMLPQSPASRPRPRAGGQVLQRQLARRLFARVARCRRRRL